MRIGVTLYLSDQPRSIWESGGMQQCVFLMSALRAVPGVETVYAVNAGDGTKLHTGMGATGEGLCPVRFDEIKDEVDVLVQCGAQLNATQLGYLRLRGCATVAYKFGNEFVIATEKAIRGGTSPNRFDANCFDEVWTIPQHEATCAAYWETLYRAPVRVMPHVWEPTFIDGAAGSLGEDVRFGYVPGRESKRIAIYEPNINIVKTAIVPLLLCENAYRADRSAMEHVYVACGLGIKESLAFQRFATALDLVRDHRCSFEGRWPFPWFQAKHADVVVAHQWECALNYAYYEALHGHYPLIHNSPLLPAGYRYDGFDSVGGSRVLLDALANHDERDRRAAYDAQADEFLSTVRATAPANVEAHRCALASLFERRLAA